MADPRHMKMETGLQQKLQQQLKIAPQLIQSIEILQLPLLELQQLVKQELIENPWLELKAGREEDEELSEGVTEDYDEYIETLSEMEEKLRDYSGGERRVKKWIDDEDPKNQALLNTSAQSETFQDFLFYQFRFLKIDERKKVIGEQIIYNIDDSGYLAVPLEEIGNTYNENFLKAVQNNIAEFKQLAQNKEESDSAFPPSVTPKEFLKTKLDLNSFSKIEKLLWENFDENLEIKNDLKEIFKDELISLGECEEVLALIQSLEPRGVGARDVRECLMLQLDSKDYNYEIKKLILEKYWELLKQGKFEEIAKELDCTQEELNEIIDELNKLSLTPSSAYSGGNTQYIYPEVFVNEVDGDYAVSVEDKYLPKVYLNTSYKQILQNKNLKKEDKDFIRKKVEKAKRLLDSIEQRKSTIERISKEIVKRQKDFFRHGIAHLKPLRMQDIASAVGVHVSTVSRAIRDKYMQTPRGILNIKFFFTGTSGRNNKFASSEKQTDELSNVSVRALIEELIEKEDRRKPLTDTMIMKKLKEQGVHIARRTVAKYRAILNIPPVRLRKMLKKKEKTQ